MKYFRKTDILVTLIIAAVEVALIALYYLLIFSGTTGRQPVGTVFFKERIATRRQTDVFHWQNLYNGSTLYEYDTLRTADRSEAEIQFLDGTTLSVHENSIIKLDGLASTQIADVESGMISVSNTGDTVKQVSLGGKVLNLLQNASALISQDADGKTNVQVQGGEVVISDGTNDITLNQLQMIQLLETGMLGPVQNIPMAPLYPAPDKKLMVQEGEEVPFTFATDNVENVRLVISTDSNFNSVYKTIDTFSQTDTDNVYTCTSDVPDQKVYWKLVYDDGRETAPMALTIYEIPKTVGSVAETNTTVITTDDEEKVKFSWEQVSDAVSYIFEVSKTADFQTTEVKKTITNTSTQVSGLDEGEYYWRVTPNYKYETVGSVEGATRKVTIERSTALIPVKTVFPTNNYRLKLASASENNFTFSWQPNSKASEYILRFYSENAENPTETFTIDGHSVSLQMLDTHMFETTGKMFWSVSYRTSDGEIAPESVRQLLTKTDEMSSFRTIFPQNNYTIASTMIRSIRFTWENETMGPSYITIARDSQFNSVAIRKKIVGNSYLGVHLQDGKYYWKVELVADDDRVIATSDTRSFEVIPHLDAVTITEPANNLTVPLLPSTNVRLRWEPVKYADYYEVSVYAPNGNRILYQPYSDGEPLQIPISSYSEGVFRITIQAFSLDSVHHTKNTGLSTTTTFISRDIDYIKLVQPSDSQRISGVDAFNTGVNFAWTSDEEVGKGTFELYQNRRIVRSIPTEQTGEVSLILRDLAEGTYSWRVIGDFNGYEISSKEEYRFTILPVEPLVIPRFVTSKQVTKIDAKYLRDNRTIHFEWSPTPLANYYMLTIVDSEGRVRLNTRVNETSYELGNLLIFSHGEFTARVKAVSTTQLIGRTTESMEDSFTFNIELPNITKPQSEIRGDSEYYGY
ncbi:MAG: FecR domain-containing protein [Spirochaetaceae bacterium]|nr:FecR domain-containing protein [Spirochaetaceae bacterium]